MIQNGEHCGTDTTGQYGDNVLGMCSWHNDSILCWPPTPPGQVANKSCSEISELNNPCHSGRVFLHCSPGGQWILPTNYSECLVDIDIPHDRGPVPTIVAYLYFSLSVISFFFLILCLYIFCSFSSLSCPRLTVHKHLMISFIIFYFSIIVYMEPYVSFRSGQDYRQYPWLCKSILILQVYSQMAAANWLFNEGFYLHSRITVQIFNSEAPVLIFNLIGWVVPLIFVIIWAVMMETEMTHVKMPDCLVSQSPTPDSCWTGWSESPHLFYLIAAPMLVAYAINLVFLLNIVRILVSKLQADSTPNVAQVSSLKYVTSLEPKSSKLVNFPAGTERMTALAWWKGMKATVVLFFFLGMSSLLFCINPKDSGIYEDAYMVTNAVLKGSQGSIVCIFYCILSSDVRMAITKRWYQFKFRRDHAKENCNRRTSRMTGSLRSEAVITEFTNTLGSPVSPFMSHRSQPICAMRLQSEDQPSPSTGRRKNGDSWHSKHSVNNNRAVEDEKETLIDISGYSLDIITEETLSENRELDILE